MEYIVANDLEYAVLNVFTSNDSIGFTITGMEIGDVEAAFRNVTDLTVSGEDRVVYGTYTNLLFESAMVSEDGSVTVVMHIQSALELRVAALETAVAEHDEAIAEMYGGEIV